MKVAIIGSCVTRDIWQFLQLETSQLFFVARTSLISLMSAPLENGLGEFCQPPTNDFERRCLEADVAKTTLTALERFEPDVLLLDFIDERFDILQVGPAFVLYSAGLQLAGGFAMSWLRPADILDRVAPQTTWLWIKSAQLFLDAISHMPCLSEVPVLLHCAPWASRRVAGRRREAATFGQHGLHQIAPGKVVEIQKYDMLMRCYYEIFHSLCPKAIMVEATKTAHLSADDHVWGPSPFHYVDDYYDSVGERLRSLGVI